MADLAGSRTRSRYDLPNDIVERRGQLLRQCAFNVASIQPIRRD